MAEPKRKSHSKQVIDIHKPGKSLADENSRPMIISNRQTIRDPILTVETVEEDTQKPINPATKATTEPLTAPVLPEGMEISYGPRGSTDETTVSDGKTEAETEPEPEAEIESETTQEPAKDTEDLADEPAEDTETKAEPAEELPVIKLHLKPVDAEKLAAPIETEQAEPTPAEEEAPVSEKKPTLSSEHKRIEPSAELTAEIAEAKDETAETTDQEVVDIPELPDQADKAKEQAESKRDLELQQLIESKKYFLPVNSAEKRRAKRIVTMGILLSVLLALTWVNIALDAGLIKMDGIRPITDFFSN